jgi:DNA-binding IclR family transcriptional regulator
MNEEDSRAGSLERGLAILAHLARVGDASATEIASATGTSRSATYRLIERLRELDYVEQSSGGRWSLGSATSRLGMAALQSTDVVQVAPEYLRLLAQQTRETVGLAVLSGTEMVFVYRERGPQAVTVNAELGGRRPLHCTSLGKAYLAALPAADLRMLVRTLPLKQYTERTIHTAPALMEEIRRTQERGWALEQREFDQSTSCCGAVIRDHTGLPVASISVAGFADRVEHSVERLGLLVSSTADAISRRLGYTVD